MPHPPSLKFFFRKNVPREGLRAVSCVCYISSFFSSRKEFQYHKQTADSYTSSASPTHSGFCNIVGIDYTFPAKIEVGVRFALNSDYRATVQIKAPKNPPASRLISSRRFQTLRGSRSNYADSPRPFDTRATRSDSRARISLSAPKQNENQTATYST
ncbi:uncharacterized protein [Anoplolepis gracilipes]|uniref:uncharacterized protein isoform X2 n=1 Tax=Anoplolepis gracilipes TaxID=354296 RepID=UPI003BA1926C